jgi:hypothetical protein
LSFLKLTSVQLLLIVYFYKRYCVNNLLIYNIIVWKNMVNPTKYKNRVYHLLFKRVIFNVSQYIVTGKSEREAEKAILPAERRVVWPADWQLILPAERRLACRLTSDPPRITSSDLQTDSWSSPQNVVWPADWQLAVIFLALWFNIIDPIFLFQRRSFHKVLITCNSHGVTKSIKL